MTTRLTLFTATLVQDSAISTSGIDRESSSDQPFSLVDGVPMLAGRGLKGAAVAMARRFFDPLPRSISEDAERESAYRRSAWEFFNATPVGARTTSRIRSGVGIRHKTGARAQGVLFDREIIPADTRWPLTFRVDWTIAGAEAFEAEGILGYLLHHHWSAARCWLGGGVARGLGWCHLEGLRAFRLAAAEYDRWVESGRTTLPVALSDVPVVQPTRSWCFRTLDIQVSFGEYTVAPDEAAWGVDMLAIGAHESERTLQATGDGAWATPSWASAGDPTPDVISTDRALLMDRGRPLIPGSSIRGPLRHAFSRAKRTLGLDVHDPNAIDDEAAVDDTGDAMFGSVSKSSRVLIRDARAHGQWAAARMHMHAEDELSAGSYGSAKRDAVRLLKGDFAFRVVVEGPDASVVDPLVAEIDRLVALGALGHLPVGGHKTRGAGWGRWRPGSWTVDDVHSTRRWEPTEAQRKSLSPTLSRAEMGGNRSRTSRADAGQPHFVRLTNGTVETPAAFLTLGDVAALARYALRDRPLIAWWCDPTIDLTRHEPPVVFDYDWPTAESTRVDEVAFFADRAVWRAARTVGGSRWVFIEELQADEPGARLAQVMLTPAHLHGSSRFSAAPLKREQVCLREWHAESQILGFTLVREQG